MHVGVLDAVVDHLDEVASTIRADVGNARGAVDFSGDGLENWAQSFPRFNRTTRHNGRTVERALFAAGDAGADEVLALGSYFLLTAHCVRVEGVAAVNDDVALIHRFCELVDDCIGSLARLNHDDGLARALERSDEVLDGLGRDKVAFRTVLFDELVGLFRAAVVDGYGVAVVGKVAGQVGAHNSQADNADVGEFSLFSHGLYPTSEFAATLS